MKMENGMTTEELKELFAVRVERTRCYNLLSLTRPEASLMAGEMTLQEWRTLSAVLAALQTQIMDSTR